MAKYLFLIVFSFIFLDSSSQVGVGTATPSSKLEVVGAGTTSATTAFKVGNASSTILSVRNDGLVEVSSTAQGFLPPRMTYAQRTAIPSPALGLLVYQTDASFSYLPGLWYFNGSDWMPLGYSTMYSTSPLGGGNVFVGSQAGTTATYQNSGLGYQALSLNSGHQNTAIGYRALYQNSTGYQNTVLGSNAGYGNFGGFQNTFLGYNANPSTGSLSNATAIGAGSSVTASNTIQLGNAAVTNVNTSGAVTAAGGFIKSGGTSSQFLMADGSATSSPSLAGAAGLSLSTGVAGTLSITNGGTGQTTANGALNALLPSQTGNANKVLVTNGTNASWATNVALTSAVTGVLSGSTANIGANSSTGSYIDLPSGKWSVQVTMLAQVSADNFTGTYWLRTFFSSVTDQDVVTTDCVGPTLISGLVQGASTSPVARRYNMLTGVLVINNTTASTKRYYYRTSGIDAYDGGSNSVTFSNFAKSTAGENSIVAYPMN